MDPAIGRHPGTRHRRPRLAGFLTALLAIQAGFVQPTPVAAQTTNPTPVRADLPTRPDEPIRAVVADMTLPPEGGAAGAAMDPSVGSRTIGPRVAAPDQVTEVTSARTERSRLVANPDGTFTLEQSTGRLHYLDDDGTWEPIDLRLIEEGADRYDLRVSANDRTVRFASQDGSEAVAELSADGRSIRLRVPATYAVSAVWSHRDDVTGMIEIDGESIALTPDHPIRTVERGWVAAGDLQQDDRVVSLTGGPGLVGAIRWDRGPDEMWNLTVETAHTYTVGAGGWLVHNDCAPDLPTELSKGRNAEPGVDVYIGTKDGNDVYAGITNNMARRRSEHAALFQIDPITAGNLTRGQARAIEQALIIMARTGGLGYLNRINSISPNHAYYGQAVDWGNAWLRANVR